MNDTLKASGRIGAELGAAKAENDRLRGLLREVIACQSAHYGDGCGLHLSMITLAGRIKDALSQQPEQTETFTAVDMATAAAQAFRDGQAAVEQAPVQDEREAVERFSPTTSVPHCGRAYEVEAYMTEDDDGEYMTVSQHERIVAALTRPAQTEQQPEQSGKFAMHQRVRKTSGSEWHGRICGTYSTSLTPEGYAVESEAHAGSVQIYPAKALEAVE